MRREWLLGGGVVLAVLAIGVGVALSMRGRDGTRQPERHLTADELTGDPNQAAEDASAAAVERLGGTAVRPDLKRGNPHVVRASLRNSRVTDGDLKELRGLTWMTHLDLQGTAITDAGLKELRPLEWLSSLDLSRTKVTGAGLGDLNGLTRLSELSLAETAVTDDRLASLAAITTLRTLDVSRTQVTGAGVDHLKGLPMFGTLKLNRTKVTDAELTRVAAIESLIDLDLSHTAVTDAGVPALKSLTRLQSLNLAGTKVTGQSARLITGLGLRRVDLTGVPLGVDEFITLRNAQSRPIPTVPRPGGKDPGPDTVVTPLAVIGVSRAVTDDWLEALVRTGQLHLLVEEAHPRGGQAKSDGPKERTRPAARVLNLAGSRVTDQGLKHLHAVESLRAVDLTGTATTDNGIEALKAARPGLTVTK